MKLRDADFFGDFHLGLVHTINNFSREEIDYLDKNGGTLLALMHGMTPPIFGDDKHFVSVFTKGAKPETKREILWAKFLEARNEEEKFKEAQREQANESEAYKIHSARIVP
jgi:uncharacterized protein YifE (UPF0438 family)